MLKGTNRQVIVVRSPDRRFFEEAIFIVREGILNKGGVTAEQVVEEARRVADSFVRKNGMSRRFRVPPTGYVALGALLATAAWCVGLLV